MFYFEFQLVFFSSCYALCFVKRLLVLFALICFVSIGRLVGPIAMGLAKWAILP